MDCNDIQTYIIDYLENTLDNILVKKVDTHLKACRNCAQEMEKHKELMSVISTSHDAIPPQDIKTGFYAMLEKEKSISPFNQQLHNGMIKHPASRERIPVYLQIAASVLILISGFLLGAYMTNGFPGRRSAADPEIIRLQEQLDDMRQVVMMTMLQKDSPSERLKAVGYATDINKKEPDYEVIGALINTLRNDDNTNVRIAAARALSKFTSVELVRNSLISALKPGDDPSLQIELINMLIDINDKKAIAPMQKIIESDSPVELVKNHAQVGVDMLL